MTHADLVYAPGMALFNQAQTILKGYNDACEHRDAYHRNLAARQAEKPEPIVVLVYGAGIDERRDAYQPNLINLMFRLHYAAILPWLACAGFWVALGSVIVEMI